MTTDSGAEEPKREDSNHSGGIKGVISGISDSAKKGIDHVMSGWDEYPEPGGKGAMIRIGCFLAEDQKALHYNRLRSDLANSYHWSGSFFLDYFFFVMNWHPVLGVFFCHPNHPWTKPMRLQMLIISAAFSMVPSAAIGAAFAGQPGILSAGGKVALTIVFVSIPDVFWGVLLYQVSILDARLPLCTKCVTLLKVGCTCWAALFAGIATGICFAILHNVDHGWWRMVEEFGTGKVLSFAMWFPLWLVLPCQLGFLSLWCAERRWAKEKAAQDAEKAEAEAAKKKGAEDEPAHEEATTV